MTYNMGYRHAVTVTLTRPRPNCNGDLMYTRLKVTGRGIRGHTYNPDTCPYTKADVNRPVADPEPEPESEACSDDPSADRPDCREPEEEQPTCSDDPEAVDLPYCEEV